MTYKIEQLLVVAGNAGFLEQGWIAYHNFFNHNGHLFLGKIPGVDIDEFGDFPSLQSHATSVTSSRPPPRSRATSVTFTREPFGGASSGHVSLS